MKTQRTKFNFTFILVILCFLSSSTLSAQTTIQIGSGTLQGNVNPLNTDYYYNYTQTIYKRTEMVAAGATTAGTITKIRYKTVNSAISAASGGWVVYMGHTTLDSFPSTTSWLPVNNMTEVFNQPISYPNAYPANTWIELNLTTPFLWNGTDNIVVAVDENTPLGNIQWQYWQTFQASNGLTYGRALYYFSDFTNPSPFSPPEAINFTGNIPQIQFEFTPSETLPVTFATLDAEINEGVLQVNWQTLTEKNVDHFEVEASEDGKTFVSIGSVKTKSRDGNSLQRLQYDFSLVLKEVDSKLNVASLGLLSVIPFILLLISRQNRRWIVYILILIVCLPGWSCKKNQLYTTNSENSKLLVRIVQVDKDGSKSYSSIVNVDRK
jgi:hypothetical protein